MTVTGEHRTCCYEERFAHIESDLAELKARMDNKKEDIHSINKELASDRQQQLDLLEKVTEVTVLLKTGQKQRETSIESNNNKFEALEDKVDKLQDELSETKAQLTDFVASQRSFRNTMLAAFGIGTPIISVIVAILLHYF